MRTLTKRFNLILAFTVMCGLLSTVVSAENTDFISASGRNLAEGSSVFYFNGANQYYLFYKSQAMVDEILTDASNMGINVIRTWGFCDGGWVEGVSFQPQPGVYDESAFLKMDYLIYKANQLNIRLIIPLVNNWNHFGGMNTYVEWSGTAQAHDDFYTDETCKLLYKNYVQHFLSRINTYTGIAYKDDPTIMIWELANEPRCETDQSGTTVYNWVVEMSSFIKSIDSNHLIATGGEGWYVNKGTDWKYNGYEGVDFIRNSQSENIDVCSFHLYPQPYAMSESECLVWIDEHIEDAHVLIEKPVYLGEFGWEVPREILGDFSEGIENWIVDWGYVSDPVRVETPSSNMNGALAFDCVFGKNSSGAGERHFAGPMDFTLYQNVSARVHIPSSAPRGLKAALYTKSGDGWVWDQGNSVNLTPGAWKLVSLNISSISFSDQVRSVGIQVTTSNKAYTGPVYYDEIVGLSTATGQTMDDRNNVYADWYERLDLVDADGVSIWSLSGHNDDTTFYPDYDNFTVYYPEDADTNQVIQDYSDIVIAKNSGSLPDQYPSVAIQAPEEGATVTGSVLIQAIADDDQGVESVAYSIDGGAAQPMSYAGGNIWEADWDSAGSDDGNYQITVTATDTMSQSSSDTVHVDVDNVLDDLPSVVLQVPADSALVSDVVNIQALAIDDFGISDVSYAVDGGTYYAMSFIGNDLWEANWNSTATTDGVHSITVRATDTAFQTSTDQINVNVSNNTTDVQMYVQNIDLTIYSAGKSGKRHCVAEVSVVDSTGNPLSSATGYGHWSGGLVDDSDVATTDAQGQAVFSSDSTRAGSGTFVFTVDDIVKDGYTYNPLLNLETSDETSF